MSEQSRPSYEFGPFSADPSKRLLLRNGEPVPLAPRVLETLLALIENQERIVGGGDVEHGQEPSTVRQAQRLCCGEVP